MTQPLPPFIAIAVAGFGPRNLAAVGDEWRYNANQP